MDTTASMGQYIHEVRDHISDMAHAVVDEFPNCTVRVAFVGYRDYTEADKRLQVLNMTNDTKEFVEFVGKIKPFAGGDVPEDVLGGLDKALKLDWKASNKIIFHIGVNYIMAFISFVCSTRYSRGPLVSYWDTHN